MPRSPEEVIERAVQIAGQRVQETLPSDVHFLVIGYRAVGGRLFLTWAVSGTPEDRRRAVADLYRTLHA